MLTGTLPRVLSVLTSLDNLFLDDNRLTGEIPDLANLTKLDALLLGWNSFTGVLPSSTWGLTELVTFSVFDNIELKGSIPRSVSGERTGVKRVTFICHNYVDYFMFTTSRPSKSDIFGPLSHIVHGYIAE
jgi:hypothetical protein